jgi:hypothetical protein
MTSKINSAYRIYQVLEKVKTKNPKSSKLEVWAEAFEVNSDKTSVKSIKVSKFLSSLHDELEIVRLELPKLGFHEGLYSKAINHLQDAFSALNLGVAWEDAKKYLDEGTLTSLTYWIAILPDEETLLSTEDLEEITSLVDELESYVVKAKLPASLIKSILNFISLIRDSLERYPIEGAKALRAAATAACGEIILAKNELKQTDPQKVKLLVKVWEKFVKTVDNVEKVDKAVGIGQRSIHLLEYLEKML